MGNRRRFDPTINILIGHSGGLRSVSYSPDGSQLASVSREKSVRIWDVTSGALLKCLEGHTGGVKSVSFSPHGRESVSSQAILFVYGTQLWELC